LLVGNERREPRETTHNPKNKMSRDLSLSTYRLFKGTNFLFT
jgi:hypothetical protein